MRPIERVVTLDTVMAKGIYIYIYICLFVSLVFTKTNEQCRQYYFSGFRIELWSFDKMILPET